MSKDKYIVAKKALSLLENQSWNNISLVKILNGKKNLSIKNKIDVLIEINRYFDHLLKENLASIEKSTSKDMLFEVLMARLDILNSYRKSVKNLIKYFLSYPHQFIKILPSFIQSAILVATLSNININGLKGAPKLKVIFVLYIIIIFTWHKDETESLEKTMTTLDNYLNNIEKFIKVFDAK